MYYTDLVHEIERSSNMESLEVLRDKLDKIDDQIAELYEERMKVCGEVGEYKVKSGRKVLTGRERKKNCQMLRRRYPESLTRKAFRNCTSSSCP